MILPFFCHHNNGPFLDKNHCPFYPAKKTAAPLPNTAPFIDKGSTMSNRRNYERYLIRKFALLKLANGETIEGETRDMSMGGAFIELPSDTDLEEGAECTVSLVLGDGDNEEATELHGNICYNDGRGIGCNFLKVNTIFYQFITELIE